VRISIAEFNAEAPHYACMKLLRCHLLLAIGLWVWVAHAQQSNEKSASPPTDKSGPHSSPLQTMAPPLTGPAPDMQKVADARVGTRSITQKFERDERTPNGGWVWVKSEQPGY